MLSEKALQSFVFIQTINCLHTFNLTLESINCKFVHKAIMS